MKSRRIVVVGTMTTIPYAGMAWMHMQIAAGLRRLGHDVYYMETTSCWPLDPVRRTPVDVSDYSLPYLARVAESFGLGDRWAYRRSYSDKQWFGLSRSRAEELLATADAVLNVSGATQFSGEGLQAGRLVYLGTDPVHDEIAYASGDEATRAFIDEHHDVITYGENIGSPDCPVPPLPRLRGNTRQPVLLDRWADAPPPSKDAFTSVCNWRHDGRDIVYKGETYYWSKHHEFLKFIDIPQRIGQAIELAMPLEGLEEQAQSLLHSNGWRLIDAEGFTRDPGCYRDYVRSSPGEFSVAKDQNVRLRSGWFSERSACYLAAGRPVVTQDTAFGKTLPTGEGLFAFNSTDEIVTAFDAIRADYQKHSRAARAIAEEFFRAETVLSKLLQDLGL